MLEILVRVVEVHIVAMVAVIGTTRTAVTRAHSESLAG
jgi:hypothetical protein